MTPIPTPTPEPGEPSEYYGRRLLRYALQCGVETLDTEQRRLTDAAAQWTVCNLPRELEAHHATLQEACNRIRHRIAGHDQRHRQQLARLQAELDAMGPDPDADLLQEAQPDAPAAPQLTDAERLQRLLQAVIKLATQPPDSNDGGGQRARLQPPRPNLPPSGQANQRPSAPAQRPADAIRF